jgi:prepilin-type processing-associated H-X9-DG protein
MFICPFKEQTPIYELYVQALRDGRANNDDDLQWFASPNNHQNDVGNAQIPTYICPSDPVGRHSGARGTTGRNSYAGCHGDLGYAGSTTFFRGAIGSGMVPITMGSLVDGTSNTLLFSEIVIGTPGSRMVKGGVAHPEEAGANDWHAPNYCLNTRGPGGQFRNDLWGFLQPANPWTLEGHAIDTLRHGPGRQWMKGDGVTGYFHAALPPNSPTCTSVWINYGALVSSGSFHTGGVNIVLADGSGRFVSETVDTGRIDRGPNEINGWRYGPPFSGRSPYGVWGALGSRNGGEPASLP